MGKRMLLRFTWANNFTVRYGDGIASVVRVGVAEGIKNFDGAVYPGEAAVKRDALSRVLGIAFLHRLSRI
jgi:hypothetical protein